ncbi:MAG: thiol oxidoreductase [Acidobacteriia bacterium]|nr:thiol oxidoreductase [Terriglobia bacterium]
MFERRAIRNRILYRGLGVILLSLAAATAHAQADPGIRGGVPGAGQPFASGLTSGALAFFKNVGLPQFMEVEAVDDGLGPRFNLDSCAGCHAFPAVGGSSPPTNNPQVARAPIMAPGNMVPSFLNINGPIREVRFVRQSNGTPDGGVHAIFTIVGRSDNPAGCAIAQPDFSNTGNLVFRIPTPLFGDGLIESITDATIKRNLASDPFGLKRLFGISGHVNTNGNDGTVTRFGWKAQNKSLLIFAGEAYNVEMGITNENFPNEREENPKCATNGLAENHTGFDVTTATTAPDPADIVSFMGLMRFLDQPTPACGVAGRPACSGSVNNGRELFNRIGCALCHTPSLTTGLSPIAALNQVPARLFSDLAVHNMGSGLADNVTQGNAGPDEFRTAPLWGLGQRAFFLHDGRTKDLLQAILAHDSPGSEASRIIDAFETLNSSQKQDILNYLRSL